MNHNVKQCELAIQQFKGVLTSAGNIFDTTWHGVSSWAEPFPPSTVLELLLPEEAGGRDGGGAIFREVEIGQEEVCTSVPNHLHVLQRTTVLVCWVPGFNSQIPPD